MDKRPHPRVPVAILHCRHAKSWAPEKSAKGRPTALVLVLHVQAFLSVQKRISITNHTLSYCRNELVVHINFHACLWFCRYPMLWCLNLRKSRSLLSVEHLLVAPGPMQAHQQDAESQPDVYYTDALHPLRVAWWSSLGNPSVLNAKLSLSFLCRDSFGSVDLMGLRVELPSHASRNVISLHRLLFGRSGRCAIRACD